MVQNPYSAPITEQSASLATAYVRVEGNFLVIDSDAVLPAYCVETNAAVQQKDMQQQHLSWCPPVVGLLILFSGFVLIPVYFLARKHCKITFGLAPEMRKNYRNQRIAKIIAAVALSFALLVAAALDFVRVVTIVFPLFLIALFLVFKGNSPRAITNYRKGEFRISGCSKEFLARLQAAA